MVLDTAAEPSETKAESQLPLVMARGICERALIPENSSDRRPIGMGDVRQRSEAPFWVGSTLMRRSPENGRF